jgi:hypothetical protein
MRELNGAESLMGFLAWVTSRAEAVTLSRHDDATPAVRLFEAWEEAHHIGELGADWPACIEASRRDPGREGTPCQN